MTISPKPGHCAAVLWILLGSSMVYAQAETNPEAEARSALDRFMLAFNSGDNELVRAELNFPHVTHSPTGLVIAQSPGDFAVPYATMATQGWERSRWDSVTTYHVSDEKVNFGVEFARLDARGEAYQEGYVFYVFTRQDGHWGMQYRAGDGRRGRYDSQLLAAARERSGQAIADFFTAFNATDHDALARVHHVPQAVIGFGNNFVHADSMNHPLVRTNFTALRDNEDWDHSEYHDLTLRSLTPTRAIYELIFERFDSAGQRYLRIPATWVLTEHEGKWGMEFRSLMRSTLD